MKECIILGCGATHAECKYHCETWGVNGTFYIAKRLDKLFMTDEPSEVQACYYDMEQIYAADKRTLEHNGRGLTFVFPIAYPKFQDLGIPIEIYPVEEIVKSFKTSFFSNSIAYMLAYALYKGYDKIWFFGIDMLTSSTYVQEKGGVEFWMGVANGMSKERIAQGLPPIEIINTIGSATGKTYNGKMYGYYGQLESEAMKEGLFAPWDMVRVAKEGDEQDEWIKDPMSQEFKMVRAHRKAGEEIVVR